MIPLDYSEFERWFRSAEATLRSAESDHNSSFYNWACFKGEQASKFAVKAYLKGMRMTSYGHSVSHLMKEAGFDKELIDLAKYTDKNYIPTRYTDAWAEGIPEEYYGFNDSTSSIEIANEILEAVREKWASLKEG
ncbi:MAG: HEPN domain-containing protein [Candidatus Thermoplasmatota archaeon]|nr:HEPN domain-containing protein [Candidatus Thermoplasmatota archaeon]